MAVLLASFAFPSPGETSPARTVRGEIRGADGAPLGGVEVVFKLEPDGIIPSSDPVTAKTDSSGRFAVVLRCDARGLLYSVTPAVGPPYRIRLECADGSPAEASTVRTSTAAAAGSTGPGVADTQVLFSDGGAYRGSAAFTFNKDARRLTLGTAGELTNEGLQLSTQDATKKFSLSVNSFDFTDYFDHTLKLGWNSLPTGSPADASDVSFGLAFESDFLHNSAHQTETIFYWNSADGAISRRPYQFFTRKNDGYTLHAWQGDYYFQNSKGNKEYLSILESDDWIRVGGNKKLLVSANNVSAISQMQAGGTSSTELLKLSSSNQVILDPNGVGARAGSTFTANTLRAAYGGSHGWETDTDTYIYNLANNYIAFVTGGGGRGYVTNDGWHMQSRMTFDAHNTYDIGAPVNAPRDLYLGRNLFVGGVRRVSSAGVFTGDGSELTNISKSQVGLGNVTNDAQLKISSNLSDLSNAATARLNLGLGTAATRDVPASGNAAASQVVNGGDTRLSDARTPKPHGHPVAEVTGLGSLAGKDAVGTADLADGSVTFSKLQNLSSAKLVGRSSDGVGPAQEVGVGPGLVLSGGTLSATGGGIVSINGDPAAAQAITGEDGINVSTSGGVTTVRHADAATDAFWLTTSGHSGAPGPAGVDAPNKVAVARFYLPLRLPVNSIVFSVSGASAGGNCSAGIYSADGGTLLIDSGVQSSAGARVVGTTLSGAVALPPGFYWVAFTADNTATSVEAVVSTVGFAGVLNYSAAQMGYAVNPSAGGALPPTLGGVVASKVGVPVVKLQN